MTGPAPTELAPRPARVHRRSPQRRASATMTEARRVQPVGWWRRLFRLVADIWRKGDRDRLLGLSSETAFLVVLTLFPTLLVFASSIGQLGHVIGQGHARQVKKQVLDAIQDQLTNNSSGGVVDTARHLFAGGGGVLTLASALALVSISTAFAGILNTMTIAYDVHDQRGWWRRRFLGLVIGLLSVVLGAVLVSAIVVGPLFGAVDTVRSVGLDDDYAVVWQAVRWPVAFLFLVVWATTLNHVCPGRLQGWRRGLPGGFLTAVLWLAASFGFSVYLKLVVPRSPVLGALGGGLILMTWIYLLCLGLLIGAELNAVLRARRLAPGA